MSLNHNIVLAAPARTPFGDFGGSLRDSSLGGGGRDGAEAGARRRQWGRRQR